jgi:hypothetical protein
VGAVAQGHEGALEGHAADQLTWLVIGSPLNRCLLTGTEGAAEDAAPVADAVDLFLAGYGT